MIADAQALAALLPQKPPLVMVHQLVSCSTNTTVSRFRVGPESVLFENGALSEAGLIENIAQTAAAGVGYSFSQQLAPAPVGFIAAIKNLRIHALPVAGTELTTEVTVQNQVLDFSIIRGRSWSGELTFAECEMRIFLKTSV